MSPARSTPAVPASEQQQVYAATGIGNILVYDNCIFEDAREAEKHQIKTVSALLL
jgi:hypothetical protein